jgi:hypothetical protein
MTEQIENTPLEDEILPLPLAINELAPNCRWRLEGISIEGLVWEDDISKMPSKEAIIQRAREIRASIPMRILRKQRDARMREVDWVTLRSVRTGEPIPEEWRQYMQALADITDNSTPILVDGELKNVNWPVRPDGQPAGYYRG